MTEHSVTPDEARTALTAILLQTGHKVVRVLDYNPNSDRFKVEAVSADTGKAIECTVYGETVAKTVHAVRAMIGTHKALIRPSDFRAGAETKRASKA
jgi:hypothetical protein